MPYNANIHHRRSIRLQGYDYSKEGLYFVTICCDKRQHRFGQIENGEMILNEHGAIAYNEWAKLTERFPYFQLDVFQIMPNHMHGIIALNVRAGLAPAPNKKSVRAGLAPALNDGTRNEEGQPQGIAPTGIAQQIPQRRLPNGDCPNGDSPTGIAPTGIAPTALGNIIGAYKSLVANGCLNIYKMKGETMGKLWQRNYYEHIIRNETSYHTISDYILKNPARWKDDKFFK